MRRLVPIALLALAGCIHGAVRPTPDSVCAPRADAGVLCIFRNQAFAGLAEVQVDVDDRPVATMITNRYVEVSLSAGLHHLRATLTTDGSVQKSLGIEPSILETTASPGTVTFFAVEMTVPMGAPYLVSRSAEVARPAVAADCDALPVQDLSSGAL